MSIETTVAPGCWVDRDGFVESHILPARNAQSEVGGHGAPTESHKAADPALGPIAREEIEPERSLGQVGIPAIDRQGAGFPFGAEQDPVGRPAAPPERRDWRRRGRVCRSNIPGSSAGACSRARRPSPGSGPTVSRRPNPRAGARALPARCRATARLCRPPMPRWPRPDAARPRQRLRVQRRDLRREAGAPSAQRRPADRRPSTEGPTIESPTSALPAMAATMMAVAMRGQATRIRAQATTQPASASPDQAIIVWAS